MKAKRYQASGLDYKRMVQNAKRGGGERERERERERGVVT
jgi:hypothetical protein